MISFLFSGYAGSNNKPANNGQRLTAEEAGSDKVLLRNNAERTISQPDAKARAKHHYCVDRLATVPGEISCFKNGGDSRTKPVFDPAGPGHVSEHANLDTSLSVSLLGKFYDRSVKCINLEETSVLQGRFTHMVVPFEVFFYN